MDKNTETLDFTNLVISSNQNIHHIMAFKIALGMNIYDDLLTFSEWKKRGYVVKKGEKAVCKGIIWILRNGKKSENQEETEDAEDEKPKKSKFIQKTAYFFTKEQVCELKA